MVNSICDRICDRSVSLIVLINYRFATQFHFKEVRDVKNALHYSLSFEMLEDKAILKNVQMYVDNLSLSEWYAIKEEIDSIILALEADKRMEKYKYYV